MSYKPYQYIDYIRGGGIHRQVGLRPVQGRPTNAKRYYHPWAPGFQGCLNRERFPAVAHSRYSFEYKVLNLIVIDLFKILYITSYPFSIQQPKIP